MEAGPLQALLVLIPPHILQAIISTFCHIFCFLRQIMGDRSKCSSDVSSQIGLKAYECVKAL